MGGKKMKNLFEANKIISGIFSSEWINTINGNARTWLVSGWKLTTFCSVVDDFCESNIEILSTGGQSALIWKLHFFYNQRSELFIAFLLWLNITFIKNIIWRAWCVTFCAIRLGKYQKLITGIRMEKKFCRQNFNIRFRKIIHYNKCRNLASTCQQSCFERWKIWTEKIKNINWSCLQLLYWY